MSTQTTSPAVQAAWKTIEEWITRVHTKDIPQVVALYSPKDCAFWGTFGDHLRQSQEEVKTYFDSFLDCESISCRILECAGRELTPEVVSFSGTYAFDIVKQAGEPKQVAIGRFTYTVRLDPDTQQWLLVEHHSSLMPENGY
ncbi:nuclear transport factor 2 family protein [Verrucomicrobiaceae bacterium N1E253]|uniref:Nuclear transport factor 2 family protein n=1 Tax=Oceaniferula marina TaxID=2748318 RepID=A0A851GIV3_9BACT|nr:nuclear transport factor 2 family protein [Oceaniferula marina]NWK56892.1 nuclear transport factor 2 family protein [Oceaniferula marina]